MGRREEPLCVCCRCRAGKTFDTAAIVKNGPDSGRSGVVADSSVRYVAISVVRGCAPMGYSSQWLYLGRVR